jgi:hypothetical protein
MHTDKTEAKRGKRIEKGKSSAGRSNARFAQDEGTSFKDDITFEFLL